MLSQQYLPRRIGMASGLTAGLSIGLGGIAAVSLGAVADSIGLRSALLIAAAAPLVGLALATRLPNLDSDPRRGARAQAARAAAR